MLILSFALLFSSSIRLNTSYLLIMAFFLSAFLGENMVLHCFLNDKFLPLVNMKDVCTLQPLAPKRWGHQHSLAQADFPLPTVMAMALHYIAVFREWYLFPTASNRYNADIISLSEYGVGIGKGHGRERGRGCILGAEGRADHDFVMLQGTNQDYIVYH